MMTRFKRLIACGLALAATALGSTAFGDAVLTKDEDWRGHESEMLTGTINLNGHNLTVSALPTTCTITDGIDLTEKDGPLTLTLLNGTSWHSAAAHKDVRKLIDNEATDDGGGNEKNGSRILLQNFAGCYIDYDFGEGIANVVRELRLRTGYWGNGNRRPKKVVISGSQKAAAEATGTADWTEIATIDGGSITYNDWSSHVFANDTAYRSYRLYIPEIIAGTENFLELWELELGTSGELHVNVAKGETVVNTTVALTGSLKLVKEGEGTFTVSKTGQTYAGGTEVAGGQLNVPSGNESANRCLGAAGTAVAVDAGATLELNGNTAFNVHPLVLAGGTVQNSSATEIKLGDITLTADSLLKTLYASNGGDFGIASNSRIDLGGFKLTVDFQKKAKKQLVIYGPGVQMENGTIRLENSGTGWGCLWLKGGNIDAPTVSFEVADAQFNLDSTLSISNYTALSALTVPNHEGVALNVSGTFKPFGGYFYAATLQNGAVLDLSDQTAAWSTTCTGGKYAPKTVTFASGATITIDVGARELAKGDQVVAWSAIPANVLFRIVGTEILADEQPQVTAAGIFYTADPDAIMTATWTGEAGDGNVATPGNWACTNAVGHEAHDVLPGEKTTVTFADGDLPDIAAGSKFTAAKVVLPDVVLAGDCDWSGLDATIPVSGKIDLKGNNFTVANLPATWTAEITDSNATTVYERLEYIESTGVQYIDTDYIHKANTMVECAVDVSSTQPNQWSAIFGARKKNYGSNAFCFFAKCDNTLDKSCYNRSGKETRGGSYPKNVKTTLTCLGKTSTWKSEGGTSGGITTDGTADAGVNTMFVFNLNTADTGGKAADGSGIGMKLYAFKISEADEVKRDFVPAKRLSDGKIGLLDLANFGPNEFYVNRGTGADFTEGEATGEKYGCGGELHVNVANGETVENTTVTLSGTLKLVKEGEGTFKAKKTNQTYTGGTVVSEGTLVYGTDTCPVGPKGKTVTVAAGATLDMNGILNTTSCIYNYDLAGTVRQFAAKQGWEDTSCCFGDITLSGNATIIGQGYNFAKPNKAQGLITFNGHKLSFDIVDAQEKGGYIAFGAWRDEATGGTIEVLRGQLEANNGHGCTRTLLAVRSAAQLTLLGDFDTGGLEYEAGSWVADKSAPTLQVYGRYLAGTMRPPLRMRDGSTLDLSAVNDAWSIAGIAPTTTKWQSYDKPGLVSFASGATITIDLGTRTDTGDHGKIIAWSSIPTGVTFKRAEGVVGRLVVKEDGLYLTRGLMLIFQ